MVVLLECKGLDRSFYLNVRDYIVVLLECKGLYSGFTWMLGIR